MIKMVRMSVTVPVSVKSKLEEYALDERRAACVMGGMILSDFFKTREQPVPLAVFPRPVVPMAPVPAPVTKAADTPAPRMLPPVVLDFEEVPVPRL